MKVNEIYFANKNALKYYKEGEIIGGQLKDDTPFKVLLVDIENRRMVTKSLNWFERIVFLIKQFFLDAWKRITELKRWERKSFKFIEGCISETTTSK